MGMESFLGKAKPDGKGHADSWEGKNLMGMGNAKLGGTGQQGRERTKMGRKNTKLGVSKLV